MTPKFELFSKNEMNNLYQTEIMQTYWLQMLDKYRDERDTPYSGIFEFWTEWLFKYYNKILLGEATESA